MTSCYLDRMGRRCDIQISVLSGLHSTAIRNNRLAPAHHDSQKLTGCNNLRVAPSVGEVFRITRHHVCGSGGLGTSKKDVVIWVGTYPDPFDWPNPERLLANGFEGGRNNAFVKTESGTADNFFVLGKHVPANAESYRTADCQQENLSWGPRGCRSAETIMLVSRTTLVMRQLGV